MHSVSERGVHDGAVDHAAHVLVEGGWTSLLNCEMLATELLAKKSTALA